MNIKKIGKYIRLSVISVGRRSANLFNIFLRSSDKISLNNPLRKFSQFVCTNLSCLNIFWPSSTIHLDFKIFYKLK